jgi:hypothetical protein
VPTVVASTMSKAAELDFLIQRGDDLSHIIQLQDSTGILFPVTGYTAVFEVFSTSEMEGVPLLSLTTANGGITVNGAAGQFTLVASDASTTALTWSNGYYRMQVTSPGGITTRILQGECSVL